MLIHRRILLIGGAAAIAAIATQPAAASAGTLICDSWFPPTWVLQFECGGGLAGVGCYWDGTRYDTFECAFNTPGGNGCDMSGCFPD